MQFYKKIDLLISIFDHTNYIIHSICHCEFSSVTGVSTKFNFTHSNCTDLNLDEKIPFFGQVLGSNIFTKCSFRYCKFLLRMDYFCQEYPSKTQ